MKFSRRGSMLSRRPYESEKHEKKLKQHSHFITIRAHTSKKLYHLTVDYDYFTFNAGSCCDNHLLSKYNTRIDDFHWLYVGTFTTSKTVSANSVSSPLHLHQSSLIRLLFCLQTQLLMLTYKTSEGWVLSLFAPTPFNCVRIFTHVACFSFFVAIADNSAKTIILCCLTS